MLAHSAHGRVGALRSSLAHGEGDLTGGAVLDAPDVLLVEDDDGDAFLVREELDGLRDAPALTWVRSIAEAAAALAEHVPACILLDLGLPDGQGLEALTKLRELAPDAAIVVLTGLADEQQGVAALSAGAQDYLVKGTVDGALLGRALRYAAERRRAERAQVALREAELQARENARLERGLLPTPIVHDPRARIATAYEPGRRRALLGGDFFDVVQATDGTIHVIVGDVSGHSADEAALGASLRIAWRTLLLNGSVIDHILPTLDLVLAHERHNEDGYATAVTVAVGTDRRTLEIRLAGHPSPLVLHGGRAVALQPPVGLPIGLGLVDAWPVHQDALPEGGVLMLYTDGLVEGRTPTGRLGAPGLVALLEEEMAKPGWDADLDAFLAAVIGRVEALNGGAVSDDIAILLVGFPA